MHIYNNIHAWFQGTVFNHSMIRVNFSDEKAADNDASVATVYVKQTRQKTEIACRSLAMSVLDIKLEFSSS